MSSTMRLSVLGLCLIVVAAASNVHGTQQQVVSGAEEIDLHAHGLPTTSDIGDYKQAEQLKEIFSGFVDSISSASDEDIGKSPYRPTGQPPIKSKGAKTLLWITFILMLASAIGFSFLGSTKPMHLRSHAFVSTGIVSFAAAAYFAIASNKGYTDVSIYPDSYVVRGVYYARYIDWMFTTPLLLLDILLIAGTSFGTTLWIVFCDILMIALGLVGSVISDSSKWGWFGFACAMQLLVTYGLLVPALQAVQKRSDILYKYYVSFAVYLGILWLGYPIVWGLAEGSNTISSDVEAVIYAILDILAKVVFGWAIMLSTSALHKEIVDVEKREGVDDTINALTTPINLVWGTSGSTAAYHQTAGDATDAGDNEA